MTNDFLWLNGTFHPSETALLPATSAGLLLGWGVFTTLGVRDGRALFLSRHLARLRRDAEKVRVDLSFDDAALAAALGELLERNAVRDGVARLTVTQRGDGRWNTQSGSDFLIVAHNTAPMKLDNVCLMLSPFRSDQRRATAGVKCTSYADFQTAWRHAQDKGFDEALLCNASGALCEATRANIFWVRDGALWTPSLESGCLPGIAREVVLEIAAREGIAAHQGLFSVQELLGADEVFLTSSTNGPRSVEQFSDGSFDIGYPSPGDLTGRFQGWWILKTKQPDV